mgnify:CR=1 FL=1
MKEKALENILKLKHEAIDGEIALLEDQVQATQESIAEAKADGEDLSCEKFYAKYKLMCK